MKRFLLALLFLIPCSAFATTTVTGKIQNLGTANVTSGAFVRFWLRGCAGNQPRINGTSLIGPTQGGVFFFDMKADGTGSISGTLYSTRDAAGTGNGDIECGGSKIAVWYGMQVYVAGKGGPEVPIHAANGVTLNITSVQPIISTPPPAVPGAGVVGPQGATGATGATGAGGPGGTLTNNGGFTSNGSACIQGPIPSRNACAYGAKSSTQTFTATTTSGSPTVTINAAGDWANGDYISIQGAGAAATVGAPSVAGIAITSIARVSNVVTATVASTGQICYTCPQMIQISGYTAGHVGFNGYFFTSGGSATTVTWNQTAADDSVGAGGTIAGAFARYQGNNPGATSHTYVVASVGAGGGVSAKSANITLANDPATLTEIDYNWLYLGFDVRTVHGFPPNVDYVCIWRDNVFIGRAHVPGYKDDSLTWVRNTNCPAAPPAAATADTLTAKILSGAGTTTLVLDTNAGTSGSGLFTFHDIAPAVNAAFVDVATDMASSKGAPYVWVPAGNYYASRIVVDGKELDVTGTIHLTTHPIRIKSAGIFQGHGIRVLDAVNYNWDGQAYIDSGNMDGFTIAGGGGGATLRGASFSSSETRDINFLADGSSGANGITVENVTSSHYIAGECVWADGNIIFVRIYNLRCTAAKQANGAPWNMSAIHLSSVWAGGSWIEWHMHDLYFNFGDFRIDSPAPPTNFAGTPAFIGEITGYSSESGVSQGVFTVDGGCLGDNSVYAYSFGVRVAVPLISGMAASDRSKFDGGIFYPRIGTTNCLKGNQAMQDGGKYVGVITSEAPVLGANVPLLTPVQDISAGFDAGDLGSDTQLNYNATRIGQRRSIIGGPLFLNRANYNNGNIPSMASLMYPPYFTIDDGGAGGSCGAGLTKYFMLSVSDGAGWTKIDKTVSEISATTGAGGELIRLNYGAGMGFGQVGAKYRVWFGTTPGGEDHYIETSNLSSYSFGCAAGTAATPPISSDAYWMYIPTQTGDAGWYGLSTSDKFGFGKINPAYSVDASNTINADIALRLNAKLVASSTAPTIASGFGTSPTVPSNNGTVAFTINVGTGGTATAGVITLPTAPTGWNCSVKDITAAAAHVAYNTVQTASSTTSVTVENQTTSTGAAVAWAASDILRLACSPY